MVPRFFLHGRSTERHRLDLRAAKTYEIAVFRGWSKALWRPMTKADLPRVVEIAAEVHPGYPEDTEVLIDRLRLYPQGCHVLVQSGSANGYVISHPWRDGDPPALNTLLSKLPAVPSTYYIHDLALLPTARRSGAANTIVATLFDHARQENFTTATLVAVNNSGRFWRKHGFHVVHDEAVAAKLRSYGADARLMRATLSPV